MQCWTKSYHGLLGGRRAVEPTKASQSLGHTRSMSKYACSITFLFFLFLVKMDRPLLVRPVCSTAKNVGVTTIFVACFCFYLLFVLWTCKGLIHMQQLAGRIWTLAMTNSLSAISFSFEMAETRLIRRRNKWKMPR